LENFNVSGYTRLAQELNVPLIDLHTAERRSIAFGAGSLALPCIMLDRTYINLPILKPSSACVISGALKNQKGLIPPQEKKRFHRLGLHQQIADLNLAIQPALSILDGTVFFGRQALISGDNCGEIDASACRLLGIAEPEHVRLAREGGLFSPDWGETGDTLYLIPSVSAPSYKKSKQIGRLRLWSNPQACSMCRYVFHDITRNVFKPQNLRAGVGLLPYTLKGAEVIMGSNPKWQKEYETVICIGECTRKIAREGGYIHVPGCPPTPEDVADSL